MASATAELERLDGGATTRSGAGDSLPHDLLELAAPTEHLLVSGGGSRLRLDAASGLNPTAAGRSRAEVLAFASSTASTTSAPAYRRVEELRQALLRAGHAGRLEPALAAEVAGVKREILARCGAGDLAGTEVVLTPSGTDGELAALHLARRGDRRLVNLVIAPEETGSGVMDAAGGRHFAPETPHGDPVAKGAALAGVAPERVTVETVEIRGPDGIARPLAAIDTEVGARVRRAVANGARCLVHLLDASKSGLAAPSAGVLRTLCARHGARVEVVVDACQLRLRPERIRSYLEHGWMVLVTGSKFAMGPPSRARSWCRRGSPARSLRSFPCPRASLSTSYFTRADWPQAWQAIGAVLVPRPNLGLVFRWRAALLEMAALDAMPEALRTRIVGELGAAIRAALVAAPLLEPVEPAQRDGLSTIFPFLLLRQDADGACRPLGTDAARQVWRWLREDLADRLPAPASRAERRLAALPCQVGQPIRLGAAGALRLCIGARLITEVGLDPALGGTLELRLERQIGRARVVLDKAGLIARYLDDLAAAERRLSAAPPG